MEAKLPVRWPFIQKGNVKNIDYFRGKDKIKLFFRSTNDGMITEICCGDRYAHIAPGILFQNEIYRGSYIEDWHGGLSGSLTDIIDWIADANYKELGCYFWMEQ